MNCPRCNNLLADNAKFCPQCGLAITGEFNAPTVIAANDNLNATQSAQTLIVPMTSAPPADPLIGRVIEGKYEILAKLGEGGMGTVYRTKRLRIGDNVAIKILHQKFVTESGALERFRREAQAAAMIHHPNVVAIYDAGEEPENGIPAFIVMELVSGEPLRDILSRERFLPYPRAVALMQQACAGIGAAHRQRIVHRDIKPDNFIVLPPHDEGESETLKVLDFGIAKLRDMVGNATLTQTGIVMGTPYYMSPEQCKGESLDSRSDVYSLGATLYEMLAGTPPFTANTPTGIVAKHLTEAPPPFAQGLNIPPALEAVIQRALAKHPDARQADASAFAREMQAAVATGTLPPVYSTPAGGTAGWGSANMPSGAVAYPNTQPQNFGVMTNQATMAQTGGQGYQTIQQSAGNKKLIINLVALVVFLAAAGVALWWVFKPKPEINPTQNSNAGSAIDTAKSGNSAAQRDVINPSDINSTANKNGAINPTNKNAGNTNASTKPPGELPTVDDTQPDVGPPPLTPFSGNVSVVEKKFWRAWR